MMQRAKLFFESLQKEPLIWALFSLVGSASLAAKYVSGFDFSLLALMGSFLCFQFRFKGLIFSLALFFTAVGVHGFLRGESILWQCGLSVSFALGFLILILAKEQKEARLSSLRSQLETSRATSQNVEEALQKAKEETQLLQIGFQEKVSSLQKEIEELQIEHSSILILNEVLRGKTAFYQEKKSFLEKSLDEEKRAQELLRAEIASLEKEFQFLKETDPILLQNKELMKELNDARYEKEQTHLINETLVRLHTKEHFKAKEAQEEAYSLKDLLKASHQEIQRLEEPLKEEIAFLKKEIQRLQLEFEKTSQEAHKKSEELKKLEEIQTERNFLRERLLLSSQEMEFEKKKAISQIEKEKAHLLEELEMTKKKAAIELEEKQKYLQKEKVLLEDKLKLLMQKQVDPEMEERMQKLSHMEPLFKQLKKQFEEKNETLHQTRSQLFKSETELQTLQLEKKALEFLPLSKELQEEMDELLSKLTQLEEENRELESLVSHFIGQPTNRKKKVKKNPSSPDQTLLF